MRFLVIGCRWFLDDLDHATLSFDELMEHAGKNSGNLFIGEALRHHLMRHAPAGSTAEYLTIKEMCALDPAIVRERYDRVVMAGSNMLSPTSYLGFVADALKAIGLPFSIIGAGAQAQAMTEPMKLPRGTCNLFHVAAETGGIAGVRGDYTVEVLKANGVHNAEAIGCPTMYLNAGNPDYDVRASLFPPEGRVVVSYKTDRKGYDNDEILRRTQAAIMQDQLKHGFHQIAQANQLDGREAYEHTISPANFVARRRYFEIPDSQKDAMRTSMLDHTDIFFTWAKWRAFVEPAAFAFGLRFHGNVMAIMAGVPTLFITHDSRTEEMCRLAGFPHVTINDLDRQGYSLERVMDRADPSTFVAGYREKCDRFDTFFRQIMA